MTPTKSTFIDTHHCGWQLDNPKVATVLPGKRPNSVNAFFDDDMAYSWDCKKSTRWDDPRFTGWNLNCFGYSRYAQSSKSSFDWKISTHSRTTTVKCLFLQGVPNTVFQILLRGGMDKV